jgi:hypothetical protein
MFIKCKETPGFLQCAAHAARENLGKIQKDTDGPEPAAERDIQIEYSSDKLCAPTIGTVTKNYLQELTSVDRLLILKLKLSHYRHGHALRVTGV